MCLVLFICTLTIGSSVLCVLMIEGMSVVVNVMLSLMSVMSPYPGTKRHSIHAVELSERSGKPCANCVDPSRPSNGSPITVFLGKPGWLAMLLIKAGDVETNNPGPTTTRKQVWICDICHRQIQVRKQISIRCNRIE